MFDDFDWGDWDAQALDYVNNFYTPPDTQYFFDDAIGNTAGNEFGFSGDPTNYNSNFSDWNISAPGIAEYVGGWGGNLGGAEYGDLAPGYGSYGGSSGSGIASAIKSALLGKDGQGTGNLGLLKDLLSTGANMNALWGAGPRVGPPSVQPAHNATSWNLARMPKMAKGGSVLDKIRELYEQYGPSMQPATTHPRKGEESNPDIRHLLDDRGMMQDAARSISGRQRQLDELERQAVGGYAMGGPVPDYSDWGNLQQPVDINTLGINSPWGNLPNGPADPRLTQQPMSLSSQPQFQMPQQIPPQARIPDQRPERVRGADPRALRKQEHEANRAARMQERSIRQAPPQQTPSAPHLGRAPGFTSPSLVGYASGGQADVVNAALAGGEYVMDADIVSALGDGNTDAGAAKLDQMRENIRRHKRAAPSTKIPPKAKSPLEYMKGKAR